MVVDAVLDYIYTKNEIEVQIQINHYFWSVSKTSR